MWNMRRALLALLVTAPAAPAAAQISHNTTLLSRHDQYPNYSDVWGYVTQGGRELALVGTSNGTSIVDLTVPTEPSELAFIPGPSSPWRDIKTHASYAYIVTEGGGGLQIVDLEAMPPALVTTWDATFTSAHNIAISDGVAYVVGAKLANVGVGTRFLSLATPTAPVEVGAFVSWYIHDCVVRNDTMYAAAINNNFLGIVDVSDKGAPVVVTTFTWSGNNAHNCDLTSDGRYILTTDEVTGGDLHIFDISNLSNVRQVATWSANPDAFIHNVHVRGDFAFVAYYTEGVRIVDIANPEFPVEVGYYDTWPGVSGGTQGNWGVYPYAPSGTIYASDIDTGLYVLEFENSDGALQGTVVDAETGVTLPAADVQLTGAAQAWTNSRGFYKLYAAPGTYEVVVSTFGFVADSMLVDLVQDTSLVHDVQLQRVPNSPIGGVVRRAADSVPIDNASLLVEGTPLLESSDATGAYLFDHIPYGVYTLTASRFGFAPSSRTITVSIVNPELFTPMYDFALDTAEVAEDFESGPAGWGVGSPQDNATAGIWVWSDPVGSGGGEVQPEDDHTPDPGAFCWVTGNAGSPTESIDNADVDGGRTTLTSPVFDLSALANPQISYWRWYSNDRGVLAAPDTLRVDISNNLGIDWVAVERVVDSSVWSKVVFRVADFVVPTNSMRLRFAAEDVGTGSIVEAAIDDVMAFDAATTDALATAPATRLHPVVPNPFNPRAEIRFELDRGGPVELLVFDVRGRIVRNLWRGDLGPGIHEHDWDGRGDGGRALASGAYWIQLRADGETRTRRAVLLK